MKRRLAVLVLGLMTAVLLPGVARASTVGDGVTIDSPTQGEVLTDGAEIDLEAFVPADGYTYLGQICTQHLGCSGWAGPYTPGATSTQLNVIGTGPDTGTAQMEGYDPADPSTILWTSPMVNFSVKGQTPRLYAFHVSSRSFYPIVRDHFRDSISVYFAISRPGTVHLVITHAGKVIDRYERYFPHADGHPFIWNGQTTRGKRVVPGVYGVHLLYAGKRTVTIPIKVLHRRFKIRHDETKIGVKAAARGSAASRTGGSCNWGANDGSMLSTCLFAHAWVRYVFGRGHAISGSVTRSKGLFACHGSSRVGVLNGRVEVTFTNSNPSGFSQCWIHHASARWYDLVWR